ncbi:U3 snoRNP protein [Arthrobotrys musiformis]|uniref:U3 snoRNP protein n=1 Tax=Arthrobotrys musiformis TaxID=47236 RepID=A0AAV9W6Q8_9PEZI
MAVKTPKSKVAKSTRKGGTASSKRHTFQTFTQKIASIKIDPIRRIRRFDDSLPSETSSHFFETLTEYNDLYLSSIYVDFTRSTTQYTESLPHILYHQDLIVTNLDSSISKCETDGEDSSLQPLLGLIPQLARDLGVEFEKHFERFMKLITGVIVRTKNVQVVEWAFEALAYVLKYLSRLLVEDLRPLYTIVAPLLGKETQKYYTTRFMAEAMSFLIRKTKGEGLNSIIQFIARDLAEACREDKKFNGEQYIYGLRTLFVDTCMGVDHTLHTRAEPVLKALLAEGLDKELGSEVSRWEEVVTGTIIGLIHKIKQETAGPLLEAVYEFVETVSKSGEHLGFAADLMFAVEGTRKGGRISNWAIPSGLSFGLLKGAASAGDEGCYWRVLQGVALVFQQADLGLVLQNLRDLVSSLSTFKDGAYFLSFTVLLAESGLARFGEIWAQEMMKFVSTNWARHEDEILMTLAKLRKIYESQVETWTLKDIPTPALKGAEKAIAELSGHCKASEDSMETDEDNSSLVRVFSYLETLKASTIVEGKKQSLAKPMKALFQDLRDTFSQGKLAQHRTLAVMGLLLYILVDLEKAGSKFWEDAWESFSELGRQHGFLIGIKRALEKKRIRSPPQDSEQFESIFSVLEKNLESPSHELRSVSLDTLSLICTSGSAEETEAIDLMQTIENTAISITTSRNISMHVRKLGLSYQAGTCGKWGARLLPHLCFGLLTVKYAPLWEDVIGTLAKVAEKKDDEVASLAFSWLTVPKSEDEDDSPATAEEEGSRHVSEFECSNLDQLIKSAAKTRAASTDPLNVVNDSIDKLKDAVLTLAVSRSQALRLLHEIPQVAEKRSRQLVPLFLEWAQQRTDDSGDDEDEESETSSKWSRNDQMAMLQVFSKFHNPKVLFRSNEVYTAMLDIVASGDMKRQTAALECIFTWKLPAIRPYEENLTNLINESKFRDEITNFIQVDKNESIIQDDHRSQLMPVLLRVLYGRSLSRKNASAGSRGMESRRISILASLANFRDEDIKMFVDIAMDELKELEFVDKSNTQEFSFNTNALDTLKVTPRKQLGFVNMIEDMLKQLGKSISHVIEPIFDNLMICLVNASRHSIKDTESEFEAENLKAYRTIRQVGFRCINECFTRYPDMAWARYMPAFFKTLVEPRVPNFAAEHAQSKSGLLNVFVTWSAHANTVLFLQQYNDNVLRQVAECLGIPSVSNDVVLEITTLVLNLVLRVEEGDSRVLRKKLLAPYVDSFLQKFGAILEKSLAKDTLEKCVETVSQLAAYADGTAETKKLLDISLFLLSQPTRRVNPKAKSDILRIVYNILPNLLEELEDDLIEKAFKTATSQFSFFRDRESRELLAKVLTVFAEKDESLEEVAKFCEDMNTYSMRALGEPDFNKRLAAFAEINEDRYQVLTARQWIPIIYNMLFFIRDQEELTTRTNASYCLRRFVERAGKAVGGDEEAAFADAISTVVLPAIKNGLREASELIRVEYINVLGHIVKECETSDVKDMHPLLFGGDEEANFFFNILHIQQHRRAKAIRKLGDKVETTRIGSASIAHYLIPLVEHFIFDQDEGSHNLANDSIKTLSVLAANVEWPQYRALFKRYLSQMKENPGEEKVAIRVISGMAEALLRTKEKLPAKSEATGEDVVMEDAEPRIPALEASLPAPEKLEGDILRQMLPQLLIFLKQKDESTVSLRVPVAVAIVKLMKVLSDEAMGKHLPPVLTSLCHILRSRDPGSRDLTRQTLCEIAGLLGPKYFGFILKELRGALLRGYQLHVLSFTVHAIMVAVVPNWEVGALDYCAAGIMNVVMDDTFGITASEKEAEGYTNKMKEIKSNKSYDTAELLSSITTLPYLGDLIKPIRAVLLEKLNFAMLRKVDELLRRLGLGILRNQGANSRDILVFSYELVEEAYKASKVEEQVKVMSIKDEIRERFIVNLRNSKSKSASEKKNIYWFKLLRFAMDIVRNVVQKHSELMTPANMDAWVTVVGDNIRADEDELKIASLRLLTTVINVPLPKIDKSVLVFVKDCYQILQDCPSTGSELAQASLKLLGTILKEKKSVEVRPAVLSYVLMRIQPDLVELNRQGLAFNFMKSVLARKVMVPEVYDVVDEISKLMVRSHSKLVRDNCRGLYFQYLMEYPHSKKKLDNQLSFLIDNLGYEHQEGRESVLDAINVLLMKVGDDLAQEVVVDFFPSLVVVVANDEAEKCREFALYLMKRIFQRADEERTTGFLAQMRGWLGRGQKEVLRRVCFRLWLVYAEVAGEGMKDELGFITSKIEEVAKEAMAGEDDELEDDEEPMDVTWDQVHYALQLWVKLSRVFREDAMSGKYAGLWKAVRSCEASTDAKVKLVSTQLTGLFLSVFPQDYSTLPLRSGKGLELDARGLYEIGKSCSGLLLAGDLTEPLSQQAIANLVFVGRCFQATKLLKSQVNTSNGVIAEKDDGDDDEWGGIEDGSAEEKEPEETMSESEDEAEEAGPKGDNSTALSWLVHRINSVIRNDDMIHRKNILGKKAAFLWVATMTQEIMTPEDLSGLAVKIILPIYNLVESENEHLNDLKPVGKMVLQTLSTKMGTTAYAQAYATVRAMVLERRRVRRHKRSIQLVTNPEIAARKKIRKHERGKESKREKNKIYRDNRRAKFGFT